MSIAIQSRLLTTPFVSEPAQIREQLNRLRATGGGDEPESLLDAIYKVATVGQSDKEGQTVGPYKWRYRSSAARVVIIFTDASYPRDDVHPRSQRRRL